MLSIRLSSRTWLLQVAALLSHKDSKLGIAAAEILVHAASYMAQDIKKDNDEEDEEQEESEQLLLAQRLKPALLQLCSSGSPKAAKAAIRCDNRDNTSQTGVLCRPIPALEVACFVLNSSKWSYSNG